MGDEWKRGVQRQGKESSENLHVNYKVVQTCLGNDLQCRAYIKPIKQLLLEWSNLHWGWVWFCKRVKLPTAELIQLLYYPFKADSINDILTSQGEDDRLDTPPRCCNAQTQENNFLVVGIRSRCPCKGIKEGYQEWRETYTQWTGKGDWIPERGGRQLRGTCKRNGWETRQIGKRSFWKKKSIKGQPTWRCYDKNWSCI